LPESFRGSCSVGPVNNQPLLPLLGMHDTACLRRMQACAMQSPELGAFARRANTICAGFRNDAGTTYCIPGDKPPVSGAGPDRVIGITGVRGYRQCLRPAQATLPRTAPRPRNQCRRRRAQFQNRRLIPNFLE